MRRDIFIQKYRPRTLNDVIGQGEVVELLKRYVKENHLQHMLFTGPAGVGKTTCALALARDLYGKNWRANVLQLNASDEGGVDVMRTKVKNFAKVRAVDADFKICFIDEADFVSSNAQAALRRMMEDYSKSTRFILSCNFPHKIIDPIKDRCKVCSFKHLTEDELSLMINRVCNIANLKIDEKSVELISTASRGSMRKAVSILEDVSIGNARIVFEDVKKIVGSFLEKEDIPVLFDCIQRRDIRSLHEKVFYLTRYKNIPPDEVVFELIKHIDESEIDPENKMKMIWLCGEYDWRISQGANPEIQLSCLFRELIKV